MHKSHKEKPNVSEIDDLISRNFDIKKRLGRGAYGIVWRATDRNTGKSVALKKIFDAFRNETDAQRTFREIMFLRAFRNHPNIIQLYSVHRAANDMDIYLSFEHMESDLHNVIKRGNVLKDLHKRYIMYQLLSAMLFIHSGNVIHRDLKPSNILVDSTCRCKIADFGLARSIARSPTKKKNSLQLASGQSPPGKLTSSSSSTVNSSLNSTTGRGSDEDHVDPEERQLGDAPILTDYVATRWYRAPEILIASKRYTKGIDMWSLGCILGEMIRGKPLFPGSCTINQIERIVKALPWANEQDLRTIHGNNRGNGDEGGHFGTNFIVMFQEMLKTNNGAQGKGEGRESLLTLDQLLYEGPEEAVELTKKLLVLDPLHRLTAKGAIQHCYVERFRKSSGGGETELTKDILPPFRDDIQLTVNEYRAKIYEIMSSGGNAQQMSNKGSSAVITGSHNRANAGHNFRAKTKKFASAGYKDASLIDDGCGCPPADRLIGYSTNATFNGVDVDKQVDGLNHFTRSKQLTRGHMTGEYQTRMNRRKMCGMPAVGEAQNYKTYPPPNHKSHTSTVPVQINSSYTAGQGVVLPRTEETGRINGHPQLQERGTGRGTVPGGIAMPQKCYENRLKVLEEKIRRHKQEMTDFMRVGNSHKRLANIQNGNQKTVQAVTIQNGRLIENPVNGNVRRTDSKLSCSSSSTNSTLSLKQPSQQEKKPAFKCGCSKPNLMPSRSLGGGMGGKLYPKVANGSTGGPGSSLNSGYGVIAATDLYKLRASEIVNRS